MSGENNNQTSRTLNWHYQMAKGFTDPAQVGAKVSSQVTDLFAMRITPYYYALIDTNDPHDPIARMCIPSDEELGKQTWLDEDPIDEQRHSPIPGVIRRYPDRVVLLVSNMCAVNCRHCTRRSLGEKNVSAIGLEGMEKAIEYLAANPEVKDVILSGGDPLLLEDEMLVEILEKIRKVESVEIIRVGTRVPVTLPMRIDQRLSKALAKFAPLYVNTQFNHPREITPQATHAIAHLVDAGIPVGNQAVLLKGVNDTPEIIEELCRGLLKIRVRPYYLFLCDLWAGTEHLRTSMDCGIKIMEHLRGRLSGIGIPQLIADLAGGVGKVPISPEYVIKKEKGITTLRSPTGQIAIYPDPFS